MAPDDVVPWLIMALLTEIHCLFIQSPWILESVFSSYRLHRPSEVILVWVCNCWWKVVTVSSLAPDVSVDLRLR